MHGSRTCTRTPWTPLARRAPLRGAQAALLLVGLAGAVRAAEPTPIDKPGTYPPGTYRFPCQASGDDFLMGQPPGTKGGATTIESSFVKRRGDLPSIHSAGTPPECRPVELTPGTYHVAVQTREVTWTWVEVMGTVMPKNSKVTSNVSYLTVTIAGPPPPKHAERRLTARAGGPYRVERAGTVLLDGSGSSRGASYTWSFEGLDGCVTRPAAGREGMRTRVTALCDFRATITVSGEGAEPATDSAEVRVRPRRGREWEPIGVPRRDPDWSHPSHAGAPRPVETPSQVISDWEFGQNVCALHDGQTGWGADQGILHPHRQYASMVEVAAVDDPGGPFHDYGYAARVTVQVERVAVFNKYVHREGAPKPDGRFTYYEFNSAALGSRIVDEYYRAVERHEGEGTGQPSTGHTQAIRDALGGTTRLQDGSERPNDPRRTLEDRWARSAAAFRGLAIEELRRIDKLLGEAASDEAVSAPPDPRDFVWFPERGCWLRARTGECRARP